MENLRYPNGRFRYQAYGPVESGKYAPVSTSLELLAGLHARMVALLSGLPENSWQRTCFHPEHQREISLAEFLALYAWHSGHHLAHIRLVVEGRTEPSQE